MVPTTDFAIRSILGGMDKNFTYVVSCSRTGIPILVDAAVELGKASPFIRREPQALLITHTHGDHIAYLEQYMEAFPQMTVFGHPESTTLSSLASFHSVTQDMGINVGQLEFKAIHTPGHYYDSICYQLDSVLFTGDTLFVGRTGRVISAKSSIADLYDSVYNKLLTLRSLTRIYPGHDYGEKPTITLEENVKISPLLQAKNLEDFKCRMDDYENNRKPGS